MAQYSLIENQFQFRWGDSVTQTVCLRKAGGECPKKLLEPRAEPLNCPQTNSLRYLLSSYRNYCQIGADGSQLCVGSYPER